MEKKIRNVMLATPALDGKVDIEFHHSIINTVRLGLMNEINFIPITVGRDALIQRARNDLIQIAVESEFEFESMIWIDSDMEWDPQWTVDLVNCSHDVIGGTCRKKTDVEESYVVKILDIEKAEIEDGLIEVDALGTGFVKFSRKAFMSLWDNAIDYHESHKDCRMVFDIGIIDGVLYSEDTFVYSKLSAAGFEIWLDPAMTAAHHGSKSFYGDFKCYFERIKEAMLEEQRDNNCKKKKAKK